MAVETKVRVRRLRTDRLTSWSDGHFHAMHRLARTAIVLFGVIMTYALTVLDYGYAHSVFVNLAYDPVGWLHELFYVWGFCTAFIMLSCVWELLMTLEKHYRKG